MLVKKFGVFGNKRRYTVSTYLSNRLDMYSQKSYSLLFRFAKHKEGEFRDYHRTTLVEDRFFGSPWIAVFKKSLRAKCIDLLR
jgi:hypothetical protein